MQYNGYVYIYYDTIEKLFYVGGHYGKVTDKYTCSSTMLKGILYRRPETVKFRVLQYINGTVKELRDAEQYWLNLIHFEELYLGKVPRYFNVKNISSGGNGSANKGNKNIGGHNRKLWKLVDPEGKEIITNKLSDVCFENNISKTTMYYSHKNNKKIKSGPAAGWQLFLIEDEDLALAA